MPAAMNRSPATFLTARWRHLVMLSYDVDPALLLPMTPVGTEIDDWRGRTFVSLVGFMFEGVRVRGVPIPGHRTFEELNLRFYVRRRVDGQWRRGVVFVKEIVPRRAVAWTARAVYGENYAAMPMRHTIEVEGDRRRVVYEWRQRGRTGRMGVTVRGQPIDPAAGSLEEFISEHYWGYTRTRGARTGEYRVEHPRWRIWPAESSLLDGDAQGLYGRAFGDALQDPASAFLADGSEIAVYGRELLRRESGV